MFLLDLLSIAQIGIKVNIYLLTCYIALVSSRSGDASLSGIHTEQERINRAWEGQCSPCVTRGG